MATETTEDGQTVRRCGDLYQYRTTTAKLLEHMKSIEDSGDTIIASEFLGGRDWILVCREPQDPVPTGVVEHSKVLAACAALGLDPESIIRLELRAQFLILEKRGGDRSVLEWS